MAKKMAKKLSYKKEKNPDIDKWKSREWRLENLYKIINENGEAVPFKLRDEQRDFIRHLHNYNIILKARQLGFTTLIDILGLDMTIFTANFTMIIIAENLPKAAEIFSKKIVYPYDNLPEEIKKAIPITSLNKSGEIKFGNGSSIKVMVSARSGTCQFLHISEYGPICAKEIMKAKEIMNGSLPAVSGNGFIFIESTAMGNAGYFYEMVQSSHKLILQNKKLNNQEYQLHFYPWWKNKNYVIEEEVTIPERLEKYFLELHQMYGISLSFGQMYWYVIKEALHKEDMWSEYPSYIDESFKVAKDGAYYAREFNDIYTQNRITNIPYVKSLPVWTVWDLGISDATAIWVVQFFGKEVRVLSYEEFSGEGLEFYANVVRELPYSTYGGHLAPHDIAVRELGTGISRLETAKKFGLEFTVIPASSVQAGIQAVRELLPSCFFDQVKTEQGIVHLQNYAKEWNEKRGCYSSTPKHDEHSHGADAFRMLAVAYKEDSSKFTLIYNNKKNQIKGAIKW